MLTQVARGAREIAQWFLAPCGLPNRRICRYADASKEKFKSSTRLECMMQVSDGVQLLLVAGA